MLTGVSSATRASHQCAISSACSLVCAAAKRQPVAPVQATSPARIELASVARPSAAIALRRGATLSSARRRSAGSARRSGGYRRRHVARDVGEAAHLRGGQLADRQHDADPVQALPASARCTPIWASAVEGRARLRARPPARGSAARPSFSSTAARNLSKPQASSTYFSRALLRSVRSPCSMKTRTMASATAVASLRLDDHAGVAGEILVAGDAAEREPEPDARARRRSRPSPRPPGSRCRWCLPAPRCVPAPSKATLNLRGRP